MKHSSDNDNTPADQDKPNTGDSSRGAKDKANQARLAKANGGANAPDAPAKPAPAKTTGDSMQGMKTLSLVKGKHHFCFRYEVGQEAGVLDSLVDMVHRRELAFDWFDAAVLSHQLGQHLAKELKAFLPNKAA